MTTLWVWAESTGWEKYFLDCLPLWKQVLTKFSEDVLREPVKLDGLGPKLIIDHRPIRRWGDEVLVLGSGRPDTERCLALVGLVSPRARTWAEKLGGRKTFHEF